jgi:DNA mismatch repair protein MutS
MTTTASPSPMMAQWQACKQSAGDAILFFRLGDFYEAFYEDAVLAARELDLTLTKRQEVPMSGVPFHTCEAYIDRLVAKGYRVAIAEQVEDPKQVKGLVKREVVRIVTPGTVVNSSLLKEKSNNFIASIHQVNSSFGLALLDLTTADFRAMEFESLKELNDELARIRPSELLLSEKFKKNQGFSLSDASTLTAKEEWYFDHEHATETLVRHFKVHNLDGFGLKGMVAAINAAGALLNYVHEELNLSISHITTLLKEQSGSYMAMDRATQRHLELPDLLNLLDQTVTPMGGRLLKEWLYHPLLATSEIKRRQEAIASFLTYPMIPDLLKALSQVRDLERLIMRIETGFASPRDLVGLRHSLEQVPHVKFHLNSLLCPLLRECTVELKEISPLVNKISSALVETPPLRLSDGPVFKAGYYSKLDELRALLTDSHTWIASYQGQLREETGIKNLKVGYTKAFGYYIEVSRGQAIKMPDNFQRRQTLVNAERFITPLLKEYEEKVLNAEEKIASIEQELFHILRTEVASQSPMIRAIARALAKADVLLSLALVAKQHQYTRPEVDTSDRFRVIAGRHPVIEAALAPEPFIPNDLLLDDKQRLHLITGPNMAGKSTFIRQAALIAILAQIGSYVPAKEAQIGIIDKLFTRIGASDDLSRGQSTFMVEMAETANILHNATEKSLVILDEIGRGTSTYDGISIAWSVAEYLLTFKPKRAKTLFATHYWELTELEKEIEGAANYNVAVQETEAGIVFLHKILPGSANKSYGIHVARLAGLPLPVLKRAEKILQKLEKKPKTQPERQLSFFDDRS